MSITATAKARGHIRAVSTLDAVSWLIVGALVTAYSWFFAILSMRERAALHQFDEDLAIYDQIVWNTSQGRLFASSLIGHADNMLGDHFSPIVAIFSPVYWVLPDARVLLVGQTLALALAALPLFAFARRRIGAVPGLAVVAAYLLYAPLQFVNLFQFHEIALLPLPLSLCLLSLDRGWTRRFWLFLAVCLMVKEEVSIVILGLALLWVLRRGDWRRAAITAGVGLVVGYAVIGVLLPSLNTADSGFYYVRRYAQIGGSTTDIIQTLVTSPLVVLGRLTSPDRLQFCLSMFGALAFVPLLGWELCLAALPTLGYLLLSDSSAQYSIDRHYPTPLFPFIFFGLVLGLERLGQLGRLIGRPLLKSPAIRIGSVLALAASLATSYGVGPAPYARAYYAVAYRTDAQTELLRGFLSQVPPDASVSVTRNLVSWFSHRETVHRFPDTKGAEYLVLDWRELRYPTAFDLDDRALGKFMEGNAEYRLLASAGASTLWKRGDPTWWPDSGRRPIAFGGEIELLASGTRWLGSGSDLAVDLTWRAKSKPARSYTVFAQLLDDRGERIGQRDGLPLDGLYPTDLWRPGWVIPDTRIVNVSGLAAGRVRTVIVGLYDLNTGERLKMVDDAGQIVGDNVVIPVRQNDQ